MVDRRVFKAANLRGDYAEVQCGKCSGKYGKHIQLHWKNKHGPLPIQGTVEVLGSKAGETFKIDYTRWLEVRHK